jgi:hypothetical protein
MNGQPVVIQGYYMHYKNNVYKLIKFATTDNLKNQTPTSTDDLTIYQPQYQTRGIPNYILWARPTDMFFQNVDIKEPQLEYKGPRFTFLGISEEEVKQTLKEHHIQIRPCFKKNSMFSESIADLVFENYAIQAFAIHSETKKTQIIYNKNGINLLLALPEKEFFEMTKINPEEKAIAKYLNELREVEKSLK